jgi:hypothetical protein
MPYRSFVCAARLDDEIYEDTLKTFPELAENEYAKLVKLDEEGMKSPEGKERWRVFIEGCVPVVTPGALLAR